MPISRRTAAAFACVKIDVSAAAPSPAGVAQLVEQLIRNQQVIGSSPIAGSRSSQQVSGDLLAPECERRFRRVAERFGATSRCPCPKTSRAGLAARFHVATFHLADCREFQLMFVNPPSTRDS
jgi:hypothetical protein